MHKGKGHGGFHHGAVVVGEGFSEFRHHHGYDGNPEMNVKNKASVNEAENTIGGKTDMNEERCGKCPRKCLLSAPGCPRGMRGNENRQEGHHEGKRPAEGSAEAMIMEIGHRLHHGSMDRTEFLSVLTPEERSSLETILKKVLA